MLDEPDIVESVHRAYVDAGARVLTLNAYSATPERLARDASADLFEPLQKRAIELARRAVEGTDVRIGGCLSPLFGSYHPEDAPDFDTCLATYRQVVAIQCEAVDLFICETLSAIREVKAAVAAATESGKPVICGMSVMDNDGTRLRSGESLGEAAEAARAAGATAVAVNCSWPEAVTQALPDLAATGLAYGGWANGFSNAAGDLSLGGTVEAMGVRNDLGPEAYGDHAMTWVDAGATIVGGCCEVGPTHIAHLAKRLGDAGHTLSGDL